MGQKFHEQGSLEGYSPCGHKESDVTERACARMCTHTYTHSVGNEQRRGRDHVGLFNFACSEGTFWICQEFGEKDAFFL